MTAGVPSGQQDLHDFHNRSLLLILRRNEVTPCLSDLQKGTCLDTVFLVLFPTLYQLNVHAT